MKISVTKEDIDMGRSHSPCSCPIALASRRAFAVTPREVNVGSVEIAISSRNFYTLPPVARNFIELFDNGIDVTPFEFEVSDAEA